MSSSCGMMSGSCNGVLYVVPIPDCFNTDLPPSKTASTSLTVRRLVDSDTHVVDEATVQRDLDMELFVGQNDELPVVDGNSLSANSELNVVETDSNTSSNSPPADESIDVELNDGTIEQQQTDSTPDNTTTTAAAAADLYSTSPNSSGLLESAVDLAKQVYNAAKDVYYSLQAKDAYVPAQSSWEPKESNWTLPPNTWTPPPAWIPADTTQSSAAEPMTQLVEMGFCNRQQNAELLAKCDGNLEQVVSELIADSDSDWHSRRH